MASVLTDEERAGLTDGGDVALLAALEKVALRLDPRNAARLYELAATEIATEFRPDIGEAAQRVIAAQTGPSDDAKLLAGVVAAIAYRRTQQRILGREVLTRIRPLQPDLPLLTHLEALSYAGGNRHELLEGAELGRTAYSQMRDNPGVANSLATFLIDLASTDAAHATPAMRREAFDLADAAVRSGENRGRFYYTRARAYRLLGDFDAALDDLVRAVDREGRTASDHRERIREYMFEKSVVEFDRRTARIVDQTDSAFEEMKGQVEEMRSQVDAAQREIRDSQARSIEMITFFTSVLAIIQVSAISLGKDFVWWQSGLVILTFGAVLFLAVIGGAVTLRWIEGKRSRSA